MGEIEADAAVGNGRRHWAARRASRCLLVLGFLAPLIPASASAQFGNLCQTNLGACLINPLPFGSPCYCVSAVGATVPGTVLGGGGYGQQSLASPLCRTFRGVCTLPGVLPVGSLCNCYGDPGQIVPP